MSFTGAELALLIVIAILGHLMALLWFMAFKRNWKVCERTIYDLPIRQDQVRRELRNSLHTPIHAVILALLLYLGFFKTKTWSSFSYSLLAATVWAEIWHYASHRAFHFRALHWIHREHHKSHLNTWLTAISFSFWEKFIFDLGFLGPFALLDHWWRFNVFGIGMWYVGYLVINSFSHANFELKPQDYNRWIGRVITSTTYHSLHHSRYTGNYGLGTRILDRLFKTEWEDYERVYDRISTEKRPLKGMSERLPPLAQVRSAH